MPAPAAGSPSGCDAVIKGIVLPRRRVFPQEPPEDEGVLAQRREVETALLQRLFGPAAWAALTLEQRRLADLLMAQIVPGRNGWRTGYGRVVRLILGNAPGCDRAPIPFWACGVATPRGQCRLLSGARGGIAVKAGYVRASASRRELADFPDEPSCGLPPDVLESASRRELAAILPRFLEDLRYVGIWSEITSRFYPDSGRAR